MNNLTIVATNRNRLKIDSNMSKFFFKSLELQEYTDFEVIIVDGGSDNYEEVKNYFENNTKIKVRFIQHKIGEKFLRAFLLNVGIRAAKTPYIMCTDVDLIFYPKFLSALAQNINKNTLVLSRTTFLTAKSSKRIYSNKINFFENTDNYVLGRFKRRTTCGGCQCMHVDDWNKLRGYNEQYEGWGSEDNDVVKRANFAKINMVWLGDTPEQVMVFHQFHPKNKRALFEHRNANRLKYWKVKKSAQINSSGWGGVAEENLYNKDQEVIMENSEIVTVNNPKAEIFMTNVKKERAEDRESKPNDVKDVQLNKYINQEMVKRADEIAAQILKKSHKNKFRDRFFPLLINEMNLKTGAEIGVDKASFSKQILTDTKIEKYFCIDTWQDDFGSDHRPDYFAKEGNVRFDEARNNLQPFLGSFEKPWEDSGRAIMLRFPSVKAAETIPDNSLDFCYIDGDHSLEGIYDDLTTWIKKVEIGGIISGHDYKDGSNSGIKDYWGNQLDYRIKTVVDDYTRRHGYKLNVIGGVIKNWWFVKNKNP